MSQRSRLESVGHVGLVSVTTRANLGRQRDESIDAFGRDELFEVRRMARLGAAFLAGGLLGRGGRHTTLSPGRTGPFVEFSSQARDLGLQESSLRLQSSDQRPQFYDNQIASLAARTFHDVVHAVKVEITPKRSCEEKYLASDR